MTLTRLQEPIADGDYWEDGPYRVDVAFLRRGTFPIPAKWCLTRGDITIEERLEGELRRGFTTT